MRSFLNGQITNPADALVPRTLMQIVFLLATLAVVVFPRTSSRGGAVPVQPERAAARPR